MSKHASRSRFRAKYVAVLTALSLGIAGVGIGVAPAYAANTLTVTSTTDSDGNNACTTPGVIVAASPITLRNALCVANNIGGSVSVIVGAGTYELSLGALSLGTQAGAALSVEAAPGTAPVIRGGGTEQVMTLDPFLVGDVAVALTGLTITGGVDNVYGGGAIIAGSGGIATGDSLVVTDSTFIDNAANTTSDATNSPGGAIQFVGGSLTVVDSTFNDNSAGSSSGGAIAYQAMPGLVDQTLTITGSTFSNNSTSSTSTLPNGGGALELFDLDGTATMSITDSTFTGNTATGSDVNPARGGAIWLHSGALALERSTLTDNSLSAAVPAGGAAIQVESGATLTASYNRLTDNIDGAGIFAASGASVSAPNNWWGCNAGPGTTGCGSVVPATADTFTPYLQLNAVATPTMILPAETTSTITADLLTNSAGTSVAPGDLTAFSGLPVTWTAILPAAARASTASSPLSNGAASMVYTANSSVGLGSATATLDHAAAVATVETATVPVITSDSSAAFVAGAAGSLTVESTGYPAPTITRESGTLPAGLTFTPNGDGTATIAGTPSAGSGGSYSFTVQAESVAGSDTQALRITVTEPPVLTSSTSATFPVGERADFAVTTTGFPVVATISSTGTPPADVTFADNGDGTATLSGTPAVGSGGVYVLTLGASNGTSPDATQTLTVTVNEDPVVSLHPADQTVNAGNPASFTAAVSGFPAPTVQWQVSTDGGSRFSPLSGAVSPTLSLTAAQSDNGYRYRAVFTNSGSSAITTSALLTVGTAPTISTAAAATFGATGQAQTFSVTTSGVPDATLSKSGTLPAWLTLVDDGAGSAHLAATPPAGSGGVYTFTIRASNGFAPIADQVFTLTVNEAPTITSTDAASLTTGTAGSFVVTTTAAFPVATTVSIVGTLPPGVTAIDNGDGTATIAGTADIGTGGSYALAVTATNGTLTDATQSFTLTVQGPPVITTQPVPASVHSTTAVTFTAAAVGYPAPSVQWQVSTDSGISFADLADANAATLTFTAAQAQNGNLYRAVFSNATTAESESVLLTVGTPPTLAAAGEADFTVGTATSVTLTSTGYPTPQLSADSVPSWLLFTDNGDGTAALAGTPPPGSGGEYTVSVTADNGFTPTAVLDFAVTVTEAPTITSTDAATLAAGTAADVTVTTTGGFPAAVALSYTGRLPSGMVFTDNADGTATIAGTPVTGTGGVYSLTISAGNDSSLATEQTLTLTVTEPVGIESASTATFLHGVTGNFTVATSGGFPRTVTLTATGTLPDGLSFVDNGDGTGALSGTTTMAPGSVSIVLTSSNGVADATQVLEIDVIAAPAVALPLVLPSGNGQLTGVPGIADAGTQLDVGADGFAPGATVTFGIYSVPLVLATALADASGTARATVTIPSTFTGQHTIAAIGIAPDGSERFLRSAVTVAAPTAAADAAADAAAAAEAAHIASTGVPYSVPVVSLLALIVLLAGMFLARRSGRSGRSRSLG
jgi:hypothetical protein